MTVTINFPCYWKWHKDLIFSNNYHHVINSCYSVHVCYLLYMSALGRLSSAALCGKNFSMTLGRVLCLSQKSLRRWMEMFLRIWNLKRSKPTLNLLFLMLKKCIHCPLKSSRMYYTTFPLNRNTEIYCSRRLSLFKTNGKKLSSYL